MLGVLLLFCLHSFLCLSSQSEQSAKKGEDLDADDEKIGEEDSHFMKLAKKLTAKTLQRKGLFDSWPHKKSVFFFRPVIIIVLESKQIRGNKTQTPGRSFESFGACLNLKLLKLFELLEVGSDEGEGMINSSQIFSSVLSLKS